MTVVVVRACTVFTKQGKRVQIIKQQKTNFSRPTWFISLNNTNKIKPKYIENNYPR